MKTDLFKYKDYKLYLNDQLNLRGQTERGPKARLAEFGGFSLAYLSQVLNGDSNLNPEQANACNRFLGHSKTESLYFLNLLHFARAGDDSLKKFYQEQIKDLAEDHNLVKNRLSLNKTLSSENQSIFYSSWEYLAVHIAVSISEFQDKRSLSAVLNIPLGRVAEVLEFLIGIGLVRENKAKYEITESGIHLGAGSPFLVKHHTNWRVQCLRSLDHIRPEDLHYTSVVSCNAHDVPKIRDIMISAVDQIRKIVKDSKQEDTLMSYGLDLFPVTQAKN